MTHALPHEITAPTAGRRPASPTRRSPWRTASLAVIAIGAVLCADRSAHATPSVQAEARACEYNRGCTYGPTAFGRPQDGALSTSVSNTWSDSVSIGNTFDGVAAAQSTVSGVNHWSGTVSSGGYFNFTYYNYNAVGATSAAYIHDDFLLPATPTWNSAGWLSLSYHITGGVSLNYEYAGTGTSGDGRNAATATLSFDCYSTHFGACIGRGVPYVDTGLYRQTFDGPTDYDNIVTFFLPVYANAQDSYELDTFLSVGLNLYGNADPSHIRGAAQADFSHTFELVDADLLDASFNPVPAWSIVSGSGFDYAHIAAVVEPPPPTGGTVPEPATFALLGLGGLCAGFTRRRRLATRWTGQRIRKGRTSAIVPCGFSSMIQ